MILKCKHPDCPGNVELDFNDKVIGNFFISSSPEQSILVKLKHAIPDGKTIGMLKITQSESAEVREQVILFQKNEVGKLDQMDRFYLTCDQIPSHTLPYNVKIQDD